MAFRQLLTSLRREGRWYLCGEEVPKGAQGATIEQASVSVLQVSRRALQCNQSNKGTLINTHSSTFPPEAMILFATTSTGLPNSCDVSTATAPAKKFLSASGLPGPHTASDRPNSNNVMYTCSHTTLAIQYGACMV